jgi:hypothetical protein
MMGKKNKIYRVVQFFFLFSHKEKRNTDGGYAEVATKE